MNETLLALLADLAIPECRSKGLEMLAASDSRYLKDLKLNVSTVLKSKNLSLKEARLLALATAVNDHSPLLTEGFEKLARAEGASDAEIAEIFACTSLMNANNVFYRFRHFQKDNEFYNKTPAGLRMSIMMNPVNGKEFFELLSLALSALNGCEMCVNSHEASVKQQGASEAKVFDAVRLVSVIRSLIVAMA